MLEAMHKAGPQVIALAHQFHVLDTRNQLTEENPHLHPSQDEPQALMRAGTEGQMTVRFAGDIHPFGVCKHVRIAVM